MIIRKDDPLYAALCKRCYRALRYGNVAVQLNARMTRYDLVLVPAGGVSDIEDLRHDNDGLYLMVENFHAGMYLYDVSAAHEDYLAEKLRMNVGDTCSIAEFLKDMVHLGEEGEEPGSQYNEDDERDGRR